MTMRIMVVEDDALIALDICSLLEDLGHEVVGEAENGSRAVELAAELERRGYRLVAVPASAES